jgi:branched-chain amino acid transport system ATP-binding protein
MHRKPLTAAPSKSMRSALAILHGEHASYAALLKTLVGHLDRACAHGFKPRLEDFSTGLNFIGTFLDKFHHPKEDEFLFLALRGHTSEFDTVLRDL